MRRFVLPIALLLASACLQPRATAADAPTPELLFAKHAAAVGYSLEAGNGKPFLIESTRIEQRAGGTSRAWKVVRKHAGAYFRTDSTYAGMTWSYGFDGQKFWHTNQNGNVAAEIGYARPYDVTWAIIDAEAFGAGLSPSSLGERGNDFVVRISPSSGVPADVYFNTSTYLIDRVTVDPLNDPATQRYSDYRSEHGIQVAMRRTTERATENVSKFVWDAPLSQDEFEATRQRTYATFPASGATVVPIADDAYPIKFDATINGQKGTFILDTGAGGIFLNKSFATRAGLQALGTGSFVGITGSESFTYARVADMQIGDLDLKDFFVIVTAGDESQRVDGFIGYDLLAQVVAGIDFEKKLLTLSNPAAFRYTGKGTLVVVGLDDDTPSVRAMVSRKTPVWLDLDTGDSSELTLTKTFLDANPGLIGGHTNLLGLVNGKLAYLSIGLMPELDLGPFVFTGLDTDAVLAFHGLAVDRQIQGLVGYRVMRRFDVTLDYQHSVVYLALNKNGDRSRFR